MSIRKIVPVEQAEWHLSPAPAWVEQGEPDWDFTPSDGPPVAFLLLHEQHDVASQSVFTRSVRRLLTHAAVQALGQVEVDFDPAAHRLLIHDLAVWRMNTTGQWEKRSFLQREAFFLRQREQQLEQQMLNGRLSVVALLEDVRIGDAIDLAWTIEPSEPMPKLRFTAFYAFAWTAPVARVLFTLRLAPAAPVTALLHTPPAALRPVEETTAERRTWRLEKPALFEPEPNVPGGHWQFPLLEVSGWSHWGEVADFVAELWKDALADGTAAVAAEAARLRVKDDEPATVRAVLRFVQEEVRYLAVDLGHGAGLLPNGAGVVLRRRFGDCKDKSVLLTALLRELGVEAWPLLVAPNWRDAVARLQPSTAAFSHVIVTFFVHGARCFVDPTFIGQGGEAPHFAPPPYACGLEVRTGVEGLLMIPKPPLAEIVLTETFQLDRQQKLGAVEQILWARGPLADDLRAVIVRQGRAAFAKNRAEVLQKHFPALVPGENTVALADDLQRNTIEIRARHALPTWGPAAEKPPAMFAYGAHGLFLAIENIEGPEQRRQPWLLRHPLRVQHRVIVRGRSVQKTRGERHRVEGPGFRYACDVTAKRQEVTFDYQWETTQQEITAAQWPEYCAARARAFGHAGANVSTPSFWAPVKGRMTIFWLIFVGASVLLGLIKAAVGPGAASRETRQVEGQRVAAELRSVYEMAGRGDMITAAPLIEKLRPYYDDNLDFHLLRFDAALQIGYIARAEESAAVVRKLDPAYPLNDLLSGLLKERTGDLPAARMALERTLLRLPNDGRALFSYARVTQQLGDLVTARFAWEGFLALAPAQPDALLSYALLLWRAGDTQAADQAIIVTVRAQPAPNAQLESALAQFFISTDRLREAVEPARRAMSLAPANAAFAGQYAIALMRAGQSQEALTVAHQADATFPRHPAILHALGVVNTGAGNTAAAGAAFRDWLRADPGNPEAHASHAYFLHSVGQTAEAVTLLEKATRDFSGSGMIWLNYATVLEALGRTEAARQAQTRADALLSPAQRSSIVR